MEAKVSVLMATYNHEKFVAKAIESVLQQECNYPIKLFIGEDCSTDSTGSICKDYASKNPDKIVLISRENNLKRQNFIQLYNLAAPNSDYVAILDGDDYWTDPLKLQKQIDFLEHNKDFSICFHAIKMLHSDEQLTNTNIKYKDVSTIEDICILNFIHTLSCVFRKNIDSFPSWYDNLPFGDWPLNIINAQYGKIKFLPEPMGVYRVHSSGVWNGKEVYEKHKKTIQVARFMDELTKHKYKSSFKQHIFNLEFESLRLAVNSRDYAYVCCNVFPFIMNNVFDTNLYLKLRHLIKK